MGNVLTDYFVDLWARREEVIVPARLEICYRDGSAPQPAQCHANADRWAEEHPRYRAVRGWLTIVQPGAESGMFVRHSIVAYGNRYLEITLGAPLPFLVHQGSDELWIATQHVNLQIWPPSTEADWSMAVPGDVWQHPAPPDFGDAAA